MKAITLYQPWASLVALGEKRIETRGWATKYRGPLLIHSSKKANTEMCDQAVLYDCLQRLGNIKYPLGVVLAISNLVECIEITPKLIDGLSVQEISFGDYTIGRFAWILEDIHQLKIPVKAKGMQRLWNWDETEHLVAIDPYSIGGTRIWTPKGVRSGRKLDKYDEDAIKGLEVA